MQARAVLVRKVSVGVEKVWKDLKEEAVVDLLFVGKQGVLQDMKRDVVVE